MCRNPSGPAHPPLAPPFLGLRLARRPRQSPTEQARLLRDPVVVVVVDDVTAQKSSSDRILELLLDLMRSHTPER